MLSIQAYTFSKCNFHTAKFSNRYFVFFSQPFPNNFEAKRVYPWRALIELIELGLQLNVASTSGWPRPINPNPHYIGERCYYAHY